MQPNKRGRINIWTRYSLLLLLLLLCVCVFSFVQLFVTPWTVACQAPLSMEFPRQENWSGLPFSTLGDLLNPETEPTSLVSPVLASFHVKSLQLCLTLCDPINCSPPGSSVHGILQQEYWSGLPFPSPGDLPHLGIEPTFLMFCTLAGEFFTTVLPGKPIN